MHGYRLLTLLCPLAALSSQILAIFNISLPWAIDLATHWVWPALFILTALCLIGSIKERAISGFGAVLCVALLEAMESPAFPRVKDSGVVLKLATINVLSTNESFMAFNNWLKDVSPDVVAVLEVSPAWGKNISQLAEYPHQKVIDGVTISA